MKNCQLGVLRPLTDVDILRGEKPPEVAKPAAKLPPLDDYSIVAATPWFTNWTMWYKHPRVFKRDLLDLYYRLAYKFRFWLRRRFV